MKMSNGIKNMKKISPAQCRAARAYLGWPRHKLAAEASISLQTLNNFENAECEPYESTVQGLVEALTSAGVEFFGGARPGLRFSDRKDR
jgi:ribosome-binding protein aMBF1 (putative translation factor)